MADDAPRRYYFGAYVLTYTQDGWALIHKDDGLIGTDQFPEDVKNRTTEEGDSLLEQVRKIIDQGLGAPL